MVTVAFSGKQQLRQRLAHHVRAADHHRVDFPRARMPPSRGDAAGRRAGRKAPGTRSRAARCSGRSRPRLCRERALHGGGRVPCLGRGSCTRMPSTVVGIERAYQLDQLGLARRSRAAGDRRAMPTRGSPWSSRPRRFRWHASLPTSTTASPGTSPCAAAALCTCGATCARSSAAIALPSMIRAVIEPFRRSAALRHRAFREEVESGFARAAAAMPRASQLPHPSAAIVQGLAGFQASQDRGCRRQAARFWLPVSWLCRPVFGPWGHVTPSGPLWW